MIDELDSVVLKTDVPEHKLRAGDVGTVMMVHEGGRGYTVEFVTLGGETVGVVTLSASHVRAVRPNEIAHVREVAASS